LGWIHVVGARFGDALGEGEELVALDREELLIVMSEGSADDAGPQLLDGFPIVHAVSRRVFVIETPVDAGSTEIDALPGVAAVSEGGLAPEILEGLDETEALFVKAWSRKREESKKQRRGEGLDWDAVGFDPPDPPPEFESDDRSA
jgi:hypothetical protein